jgi:hypothetical protein
MNNAGFYQGYSSSYSPIYSQYLLSFRNARSFEDEDEDWRTFVHAKAQFSEYGEVNRVQSPNSTVSADFRKVDAFVPDSRTLCDLRQEYEYVKVSETFCCLHVDSRANNYVYYYKSEIYGS